MEGRPVCFGDGRRRSQKSTDYLASRLLLNTAPCLWCGIDMFVWSRFLTLVHFVLSDPSIATKKDGPILGSNGSLSNDLQPNSERNLRAMASNLRAMPSNPIGMASNLVAMASTGEACCTPLRECLRSPKEPHETV